MKKIILVLGLMIFTFIANAQCTGGTNAGTLNPTAVFQSIGVQNGQYYTVNVNMCDVLTFSFCSSDFASATNNGWDTQLTILNASGASSLSYNDDNCGLASKITWTAGFTGSIRILITRFSCNTDLASTATLAYKKTASVGNYCMFQSANNQILGGQNCIELTPAANSQTGCAWNNTPIDFNQPFNLSLQYYFGASGSNGADGTTFTFLPTPTGCGSAGGQLGAGGLSNALTIEFDTYDNDNPAHVFDILADHISVVTNGNLLSTPLCGPVPAFANSANLDDGVVHTVKISWDPITKQLSVFLDGNLRLTCTNDFVTNVFAGQSQIYWGATAATGGLNNQQYFCPNTVVLPVELKEFRTICNETSNQIEWISETEHRLDYYLIEYSIDGFTFYPTGKVKAFGNSDLPISYSFLDPTKWTEQSYYRLTSVDLDGKTTKSSLISAYQCIKKKNQLIQSVSSNFGIIDIQFVTKNVEYQLVDLSGKTLTPILTNNDLSSEQISIPLSSGLYLLKAWNKNGSVVENYKLIIQ